jgi:hypothetical protein
MGRTYDFPCQGEEWASELPRTARADMATREKTRAAPWEIYRYEGLLLGKKVISVVVGTIIGTHYYKKGRPPFWLPPHCSCDPKATTRESSEGLL